MSLNYKKNNYKNKGSISFVFYFIIGLALLAVAGYYIGINEQSSLFKSMIDKHQQQQDAILNGSTSPQVVDLSATPNTTDPQIKSIIDSPMVVLRNIKSGQNINSTPNSSAVNVNQSGNNDITISSGIDVNSPDYISIVNFAKQSQYFIKTNESKSGTSTTLVGGIAKGNNCFNSATERLCFPNYKLNNFWALGDLNADGQNDAIISVSATESISGKNIVTDNFYAIISSSTKSSVSATSSTPSYVVVPFNYGVFSPHISSIEISSSTAVVTGGFYVTTDVLGKPSSNKVIRYKVSGTPSVVQKISEAKLFKEQGENTSLWYLYNYTFGGLDFSFKTPEAWQRVENFDKNVKITFTDSEGRTLALDTNPIIETCSEYNLGLTDASNIKIKSSEFIDLGQFGVGSYIKYTISANGTNQYHADICVTDRNNDKKVFSLFATTKEDDMPYFIMFDKIWSTFKIR